MSKGKEALLAEKNEIEEKLRYLNMGIEALKAQRIAERIGQVPNQESLEENLRQIEHQEKIIAQRIQSAKSQTQEIKDTVDGIKKKYAGLEEEHKKDNWNRLTATMEGHRQQIAIKESEIGSLEQSNLAHLKAKAITANEMEAYKNNCHLKPAEEDPRLLAVLKEKEEIEQQLETVTAKIKLI